MKKLGKGEVRFVVKKVDKSYRVYDRVRGSFPYQIPELGKVLQVIDQALAENEALRLNELVGIVPSVEVNTSKPAPPAPAKKESSSKPPATPADMPDEVETFELKDYGVLSDDERAKYEKGLFEDVK